MRNSCPDIVIRTELSQEAEQERTKQDEKGQKNNRPDVRNRNDTTSRAGRRHDYENRGHTKHDGKKEIKNERPEVIPEHSDHIQKCRPSLAAPSVHHRRDKLHQRCKPEHQHAKTDAEQDEEQRFARKDVAIAMTKKEHRDQEQDYERDDECDDHERRKQPENKIAIALYSVFMPRLHNCGAISNNAICENESATGA